MNAENENPVWKIGPLTIEKKVDFAAFVALLLSLFAVIIAISEFARGAVVGFTLPDDVIIYSQSCYTGEHIPNDYIEFIFPLVLYNSGARDASFILQSIKLEIQLDGGILVYEPELIVKTSDKKHEGINCDGRDKDSTHIAVNRLHVAIKERFKPLVVKSGSVLSEEILLIPVYQGKCKNLPSCSFRNFLWSKELYSIHDKSSVRNKLTLLLDMSIENEGVWSQIKRFFMSNNRFICSVSGDEIEKVFVAQKWMSSSTCSTFR